MVSSLSGANVASVLVGRWPFLSRINHLLVGDFAIGRDARRYLSLITLMVAICIGLMTFVRHGWVWSSEITIRPDLISTIAAIALVGALYLRRVVEWAPSIYSILALVLNVTITSILVRASLGGSAWSFAGLSMPYLITFAIVLTWVGLRPLAPVFWGLVILVGFFNLQMISNAMGLWGYLFIILSAVGVLLQIEPNLKNFGLEIRRDFNGASLAARTFDPPSVCAEREAM